VSYATVDELAAALRVRATPENQATLQACLDAATLEIDHDIDRPLDEEVIPSSVWTFSTATGAADPGAGSLRMNKSNPQAVSSLYVSGVDADGVDHAETIALGATGDYARLYDDPSRWVQFTLTGDVIDHGTWFEVPVSRSSGSADPIALSDGMALTVVGMRVTPLMLHELALANRVNIARGVEWFKAQDAAFGVIGSDQTGTLTAPRDGFNRHAYALSPLKRQWGIA